MLELTEKEIEKISSEIDQQGLTYTPLKDEILDHVCCSIEAEMEEGLTFNEAYRKVKSEMGKKRIRQIQDETLYLISKKYRRMKRLMYVLGVAVPVLLMIAFIFKILHWPGAGLLLSLSLFTAGLVFMPVFVMVRIRDTRRQDEPVPMGLYLTGMIAGMITIIGVLFKIQHMPGSGILLTLGLAGLAFVFLPMFAVVKIRESKKKNEPVNTAVYISGVIAGGLFILGALFKVQHWPGAGIVIVISWLAVAVLLVPFFILNQLKQKENRINNFFGIIVVGSFAAILLMWWVLNIQLPRYYIKGFNFSEKGNVSNINYLDKQNEELLNSASLTGLEDVSQQMQSIAAETDQVCNYIQSLKEDMVRYLSNKDNPAIDAEGIIDYTKIHSIENTDVPYEIMLAGDHTGGSKLKGLLENYRNNALALTSNLDLKSFINAQLSLEDTVFEDGSIIPWEDETFRGPFFHAVSMINLYHQTVRLIEHDLLLELSSKIEDL